jgi:hypothetical protein
MAAQSCKFMLWQQALAREKIGLAKQLAKLAICELKDLDADFRTAWPRRNKGTPDKCSTFLQWRVDDYRHGRLHFPPSLAAPR